MFNTIKIALASVFAASLVACGGGTEGNNDINDNHVTVEDQQLSSAKTITVKDVYADTSGWLVLHRVDQLGRIGNETQSRAPIPQGSSANVAITINDDIAQDDEFYVVLHKDAGDIGIYDASEDTVLDTSGNGVQASNVAGKFKVSLGAFVAKDPEIFLKSMLRVSEVSSPTKGWLVVSSSGGDVLGKAAIDAKFNIMSPINVVLNRSVIQNETVITSVIADANNDSQFDADDNVLLSAAPVSAKRDLVVPDVTQYPDAMLTVTSQITPFSYKWSDFAPLGGLYATSPIGDGAGNQTLTLTKGLRYRILRPELFGTGSGKPANNSHPLEFLGAGGSVLLSETRTGSFESSGDVNWNINNGVLEFTLSDALAGALVGYQCFFHINAMKGDIVVSN